MRSADHPGRVATLLDQISRRLTCATEIAVDARGRLIHAGGDGIEADIARIETVAQELKLLIEEYERLPAEQVEDEPGAAQAQRRLEQTIAGLARSSAISGGLLERLILISRRRFDLLGTATEGTYLSNGRVSEFDARGVRLKEQA